MEYRDIATGQMMDVDPEKRIEPVTISELKDEVAELKAMIQQLLDEKGV
jgi:hypothetical protein